MIALLLIDDGRENYLERCRASIGRLPEEVTHKVLVEDPDHRLGFAGAIQAGWNEVLKTSCRYVFHVESDFVFNEAPDLETMQAILDDCPWLAQVALKRQPWNEREKAAGGIVEADADDFFEKRAGDRLWTEHLRFFTTNPSLYPRAIVERGWPQVPNSEGVFTHQLLADGLHFAFFGGKFDPPRVEHIGRARAGVGY